MCFKLLCLMVKAKGPWKYIESYNKTLDFFFTAANIGHSVALNHLCFVMSLYVILIPSADVFKDINQTHVLFSEKII